MIDLPRAAYISYSPETGFDRGVELAAAYLEHAGAAATAVVIVPEVRIVGYSEPLKRFAARRTILPQST
ncbi:hypothetical protein [Nocardia alni]|uniref:hypothetical protein n=1 Tax=Nocardia alni TaxID=2815723 RepID=UPI001C22B5F9|nr:hypothetical protein [Nocardia alni]